MRFQKVLLFGGSVVGLVSVLWLVVAALLTEHIPNTLTPREGYVFDYVVVGAGSAGSIVAALLAKHSSATVLLVEAGDRFGFLSKIPLLTTFQQKGLNDWAFLSVPQKHSSRGLQDQRQCLPRGKGLGGSAQLNYMLHFDGFEGDFEQWANAYNLSDWSWPAVRPFLEASRPRPHERLEIPPHYSKVSGALHKARAEFEHKSWRFRSAVYTIRNGLRFGVFQRHLQPALTRPNLRIMTNTMAKYVELGHGGHNEVLVKKLRVGFRDERTRKEHVVSIGVRQELVLSAGAYQSPQLLLVSGLGDRLRLRQWDIPVQSGAPHLPMVGQRLHDHINLPLFVSIETVGPTLNQRSLLDPLGLLKYLATGGGPLGNFGVVGHVDSLEGGASDRFSLTLFAAGAIDEAALMDISNFRRRHFRALFPRHHNASQEGFVLIATCLQPQSRGSVQLRGANTRKSPLIDPNYLAEGADVECTIKAVRAAVEIVHSEAFSELRPRIHWPRLKECATLGPSEADFALNQPSDQYLECILRHVGLGSHHPGGTCAMGTHPTNSVVDSHFRVHGVRNLRVVDASVLPTPISGNPNAVVEAMALRAATMVLKQRLQ